MFDSKGKINWAVASEELVVTVVSSSLSIKTQMPEKPKD